MLIRFVNFFCVAAMGMAILANYHVSEQTRLAAVKLRSIDRKTAEERGATTVLEAKWENVAGPARVQALAQAKLGMNDGATVQLSALEALPRHDDSTAPLGGSEIRQASAQVPAASANPAIELTPVAEQAGQ